MKRYLLIGFITLPILLVLMPAALVYLFAPSHESAASPHEAVQQQNKPATAGAAQSLPIKVYRTEKRLWKHCRWRRTSKG